MNTHAFQAAADAHRDRRLVIASRDSIDAAMAAGEWLACAVDDTVAVAP